MNKVLVLIFLLVGLASCSQNLDCTGFKQGGFIIPNDTTQGTTSYRIIRNDTLQTEIDSEGVKRYSKIKWLSNCRYILLYDEDKMPLNDFQKKVNSVGGVIVEVIKIEGNCYHYTSNIKGDPSSEQINGVMCKEK
ncbi:hypothetical protein LS482_09795 [Sinomicrobium kalidii]|uniref:hypothetical protein n=1 Tax=Sinomicrobium kalidii TaxID=2900738 RepID=UPI001E41CEA5|nr:hypothetical protein [Sinomicrobium kalidii]UGU18160.1 hypothetical protein LS482_09795 [Sinomicrobium kalidii]